jgi:hypothetical protein
MEPLKPETVKDLLDRPHVAPADVEEYQRLLAERFTVDPDAAMAPALKAAAQERETRLKELYQKLFADRTPVRKR